MLDKLRQLWVEANNLLPDEDLYTFSLTPDKNGWYLTIDHSYKNKSTIQPISTIFRKCFLVLDDNIIQEIKEKFIKRQVELISLREASCKSKLEEYRRLNEELSNRIVHLEMIKKI
mgnify:CR=1 FL=1